jgi:hypothetical protein
MSWKVRVSVAFLAATCLFACAGYVYEIGRYPRYVDFDSATLGIFVNDLSYHQFGYSFTSSIRDVERPEQEWYRLRWAASALPLTLPLSWLQRAFRIAPEHVGLLIRGAASFFGLMCAIVAAWGISNAGGWSVTDAAVVLALCSVFPPFLLSARTGFPNHLLAYLLFWSAIALALAFRRTGRAAFLYCLGLVAACAVLNPYPPLLALPILLLALLARRPGSLALLRNPSIAVGAAAALYLGIVAALARFAGMSLSAYREALATFRAMRGGFFLADISVKDVPLRLAGLMDSQILFRRSNEVRSGRSDDLWALGSLDAAWFVVFALGVIGALVALRRRRRAGIIALVVLIGTIAVLTIHGFPEVRYVAVVAPCYGVLAVCALRAFGLPSFFHNLASGALVLAAGLNTFGLIVRDYAPRQDHAWPQVDGIEEFARHVGDWTGPLKFVTFPFPRTYDANLYLRMLTNSNAQWLTEQEFKWKLESAERQAETADLFFLVAPARDTAAIAGWSQRGFGVLSRFDARSGAGPLVLLGRPARRFASTAL